MMYTNKLDAAIHAAAQSATLKSLGMQCRPLLHWWPDHQEGDDRRWEPEVEVLGTTSKGLACMPELCKAMKREPLNTEISVIIIGLQIDCEIGNDPENPDYELSRQLGLTDFSFYYENPSYRKAFLSGYVGLCLYRGLGNPNEISAAFDRLMRLDHEGFDTSDDDGDKWWSLDDIAQTAQIIRDQMGAVIAEAYRLHSLPTVTHKLATKWWANE